MFGILNAKKLSKSLQILQPRVRIWLTEIEMAYNVIWHLKVWFLALFSVVSKLIVIYIYFRLKKGLGYFLNIIGISHF